MFKEKIMYVYQKLPLSLRLILEFLGKVLGFVCFFWILYKILRSLQEDEENGYTNIIHSIVNLFKSTDDINCI